MGLMGYLTRLWRLELIRSSFRSLCKKKTFHKRIQSCFGIFALSLAKYSVPCSGLEWRCWIYAMMLSLPMISRTYTFQARYPPDGEKASTAETGVTWDRVRAPCVDASPHDLHISDCLNELQPGDHIEIQWKRNKEFPHGIVQTALQRFNILLIFVSFIIYFIRMRTSLQATFGKMN